jgi:hypothetical protein
MLAVYVGENREVRCTALLDAYTCRYWSARFYHWVNLEMNATLLCNMYHEYTLNECWKKAVDPLITEQEVADLYKQFGCDITIISYDGQIPDSTRKLVRCIVVKFLNHAIRSGLSINILSITVSSARDWDTAERRWLSEISNFLSTDDSGVHEVTPRTYGPPVLKK